MSEFFSGGDGVGWGGVEEGVGVGGGGCGGGGGVMDNQYIFWKGNHA